MTREQAYIREQMKSVDFYMLKTQVQTRIRWFIRFWFEFKPMNTLIMSLKPPQINALFQHFMFVSIHHSIHHFIH